MLSGYIIMTISTNCSCETKRVYVIRYNEDSPKHSTAMKLVRLGLLSRISSRTIFRRKAVVLDPFSRTVLMRDDECLYSIIVVDRSWKKLVKDKVIITPRGRIIRRRLPCAFAANPINYAKPWILSSAEAVALALIILGCREQALSILSKFKWGPEFLRLNRDLIELYVNAKSRDEIREIEDKVCHPWPGG